MSLARVCCVLAIIACQYVISEAAGFGDACSLSSDCTTQPNLICVDKVCTCSGNYVPFERTCYPVVKHGEKCNETIQCNYSRGTECLQNKCQCISTYVYNEQRCVGQLGLGNKCDVDSDCVVPLDLTQRTVWCHNGLCACKDGYTNDGGRCVIGGDCTDNVGCSGLENSFCDKRPKDRFKCACKEGNIVAGNKTACVPPINEIGTGCAYNEQCSEKLGEAECRGYQCKCVAGAYLNQNKICTFTDEECVTDDNCQRIENSRCVNKACTCLESYIPVENKTKCVTIVHELGTGCKYNEQCTAKLGQAECRGSVCACVPGVKVTKDKTCGAATIAMMPYSYFLITLLAYLLQK